MNDKNFINICLNNSCIDKVKNYYEKYKENISLTNINELFTDLCKKKKIDILKFLYNLKSYEDWIFDIKEKNDIYLEEDLICYLSRIGYLELAKYIYSKDKDKINLYQKNNEPIVLASQEGNVEFVKWLFSLDRNIDIFSDEIILNHCLYNHENNILEWYIDELNKIQINNKELQIVNILNNLCINDNLKFFKKMISLFNIKDIDIINDCLYGSKKNIKLYLLDNYVFNNIELECDYVNVMFLNNIDIIKKVDDLCIKQNCNLINYKLIFMIALGNNKLKMCDYIYNTHCKNNVNNNINNIINLSDLQYESFLSYLCKMNNVKLEGIKYILKLYNKNNLKISDNEIYNMIISLCKSGKYKEVIFLYNQLKDKDLILNIKSSDLYNIFYSCNLKLIKWISRRLNKTPSYILYNIENEEIKINIYCDIIYNLQKKKKFQQLKIIKILFNVKYCFFNYEILDYIISLKNTTLLNYIYNVIPFDILTYKAILFNICNNGNVDVLKWYLDKKCIYTRSDLEYAFKICCKNGNYQLLHYLYNRYELQDYIYNNKKLFKIVCKSNNIRSILWIYSLIDNKKFILDKEWELIVISNNYQLIRWILDNKNISVNKISGLKIGLKQGNLDTMKLISSYMDNYNIKILFYLYEGLLLLNCLKLGNLNILEYYDKYIDLYILKKIVNLKLIQQLCMTHNVSVIDWIKKKINIDNILRSDNDILFKNMCKFNKIISIRYLKSLFDLYDYTVENDTIIPLIKDSIEYYYETNNFNKIIEYYNINIIETKKNELDSCLICYSDSNIISNCEHTYCDKCIFKWYIFKNKDCPYCRNELDFSNSSFIKYKNN